MRSNKLEWGLSLAFLLVLGLVFIFPIEAQEPTNCELKLKELRLIFLDLKAIYNEQSNSLFTTKENSRMLREQVTASQEELQRVREELKLSKEDSARLSAMVTQLIADFNALENLLKEAEAKSKLVNDSFQDYRQKAEKRISQAETERNMAIILAIVAAILGAAGTAAGFIF